jgi:hypothetical protein
MDICLIVVLLITLSAGVLLITYNVVAADAYPKFVHP